ncbi:MAG: hypothetical protein DRJ51_08875, partial [Thermoprotei archaeon]
MENERVSRMRLEDGQWVLEYEGKRVEIMTDILSIEADKIIAEKFRVPLAEAWKLKHQALEAWWPSNLDEVRNLFPMIIGESDNVKLAVLALFSLRLERPEERIMGLIIEGSNSSGKSYFSRQILKPLRDVADDHVLEFTRMTGPFIERYFADRDVDGKIIFIQETSNLPYQIHLSLSEGRLRLGFVERVDGEFRPVEVEAEGQPFLWATSVEWRGSPDLIHRCLVINLDESDEQTERIIDFQNRMASDPEYAEKLEAFNISCIKIFKKLWEETPSKCRVIIPYLDAIKQEMRIERNIKLRRDWNKLISLLRASAILFYKHRPKIKINGHEYIVSTEKDLEEILPLFTTSFRTTLTNLTEKEEKVLDVLFLDLEGESRSLTVAEIAKETGFPQKSLWNYIIPSLEAKGFIVTKRDQRPMLIEAVKKPEIAVSEELLYKAKVKVEEFLSSYSSHGTLGLYEISTERDLIHEKKSKGTPKSSLGVSPAVFSENKLGEDSDYEVPNSQGENKDEKLFI